MDDPRFAVWNALHDGEITILGHEKPDVLRMFVDIPYVRQRIAPLGDSFRLALHGFRSIKFSNEIGDSYSAPGDIAEQRLIIISVLAKTMPVQIEVAQGTLAIDFDSVDISLDTGQRISYQQLSQASDEYWADWELKHKQV